MAKNKNKRVRLTTPKGVAKFPCLNTPNTRFNPDGEYSITLLLVPSENGEFLKRLDELADEAFKKAKEDLIANGKKGFAKQVQRQAPYRMELDYETGEETGLVEVRFKMKAYVKAKSGKEYNFEPLLFDAQGKAIDRSKVFVYGGSVVRVNFTPNSYYVAGTKLAGVSLQLNAVQVLELVERGGGSAESFGFEKEEGYVTSAVDDDDTVTNDFDDDNEDYSTEGADF